jgi:hypothetical protein
MCGKLFKNLKDLNDHLKNLKNQDVLHENFNNNNMDIELGYRENSQKNSEKYNVYYKPNFGKINIKKKK